MGEWMAAYRDCRAHCPARIAAFLQGYRLAEGEPGSATPPGTLPPPSYDRYVGAQGGHSGTALDKKASRTGLTALQAMESIWEDRKTIPIGMQAPLQQSGLFGSSEKRGIRHKVLSVLNKVSSDAKKFHEVRKELLRIPIPETNAEELDTVVDVFFKKAVREQSYLKVYADLMMALCKVPEGQHIMGDKTQSSEYRMRRALLSRSQQMFLSGAQTEKEDCEVLDYEQYKEKRRNMTGNVRFVSELFLRGIIPETIIAFIFLTCCTGSGNGMFDMPPTHALTELEVDEIIAAADVVGMSFFVQTKIGRDLLPQLLCNLQYWAEHHSTSRCRHLLILEIGKLSQWMNYLGMHLPSASTTPASQRPSLHALPLQSSISAVQPQSLDRHSMGSPASGGGGLDSIDLTPKEKPLIRPCEPLISRQDTGQSSCNTSGTFPNTPVSAPRLTTHQGSNKTARVGSRPIPAPRSSQNRASLSVHTPPTAEDSFSPLCGNSQPQQRPPSAALHLAAAASAPQTQARVVPKAEAIAKDMAQLKNGVVRSGDMLDTWLATYDDMLPILSIWVDRCLSVVREEANRLATGELLSLLLQRSESRYPREQLRELVFDGLERALGARLHEDLKLFKFWAQMVLSDPRRVVLDEELLEGGLEYVFECRPSAAQDYLVDVGQWYGYVQSGENHLIASDESNRFLRYRPLICQEMCYSGLSSPATERQRMENFADVRHNNLEFDVYHTFIHGSPPNIEGLFEKLRTSPRLRYDHTLAAEVLSAVLLAEMNSPEGCEYLRSCIPLLQIAVDGTNRLERELALIAEIHEVYNLFQQQMSERSLLAKSNTLGKLRFFHVVSGESLERVLRFVLERDERDAEGSGDSDGNGGGDGVVSPPKQVATTLRRAYPLPPPQPMPTGTVLGGSPWGSYAAHSHAHAHSHSNAHSHSPSYHRGGGRRGHEGVGHHPRGYGRGYDEGRGADGGPRYARRGGRRAGRSRGN